jgi:hypothetical protein
MMYIMTKKTKIMMYIIVIFGNVINLTNFIDSIKKIYRQTKRIRNSMVLKILKQNNQKNCFKILK